MKVTEDEARKKWCPFARYVPARSFSFGRIVAAVNRWIDNNDVQVNPVMSNCIGSKCMLWVTVSEDYEYNERKISDIPPTGEDCPDVVAENKPIVIIKGYCGMKS